MRRFVSDGLNRGTCGSYGFPAGKGPAGFAPIHGKKRDREKKPDIVGEIFFGCPQHTAITSIRIPS